MAFPTCQLALLSDARFTRYGAPCWVDSTSSVGFCGYREKGMNERDMKPSTFLNKPFYCTETPAKYGRPHKALAAFLLGFIFLSISPAFSHPSESVPDLQPGTETSKDPIFFDAISPAIDLVLHDRYKESLLLFEEIQQTYPDHPAPPFL